MLDQLGCEVGIIVDGEVAVDGARFVDARQIPPASENVAEQLAGESNRE